LQHGGIEEARKAIEQLIGLFGRGNVYIELQRHFHREEETRNRAAIAIARRSIFPCSQPTASAMPLKKIANSATHSPPSGITAHCRPPDVCWRATPNVI
jgi:hypothetical protein